MAHPTLLIGKGIAILVEGRKQGMGSLTLLCFLQARMFIMGLFLKTLIMTWPPLTLKTLVQTIGL